MSIKSVFYEIKLKKKIFLIFIKNANDSNEWVFPCDGFIERSSPHLVDGLMSLQSWCEHVYGAADFNIQGCIQKLCDEIWCTVLLETVTGHEMESSKRHSSCMSNDVRIILNTDWMAAQTWQQMHIKTQHYIKHRGSDWGGLYCCCSCARCELLWHEPNGNLDFFFLWACRTKNGAPADGRKALGSHIGGVYRWGEIWRVLSVLVFKVIWLINMAALRDWCCGRSPVVLWRKAPSRGAPGRTWRELGRAQCGLTGKLLFYHQQHCVSVLRTADCSSETQARAERLLTPNRKKGFWRCSTTGLIRKSLLVPVCCSQLNNRSRISLTLAVIRVIV